jgi:hypothetical protein
MDHRDAGRACGAQQSAERCYDLAHLRNIIAERIPEATGLQEVALHVDDDERALGRIHGDGRRLGIDSGGSHDRSPIFGIASKRCAKRPGVVYPLGTAVDTRAEQPHKSGHDQPDDTLDNAGATPTLAPRAGAMTAH